MTAKISVQINYVYEHDDQVGGFGLLHTLIEKMRDIPACVTVDTVGQETAPASGGGVQQAAQDTTAGTRRRRGGRNGAATTAAPPEDLTSSTEDGEDGGLGEEPPAGSLSDVEAKQKGLETLKTIYAAHPDPNCEERKAIRSLQKELAVAKFQDIPDKDGHAFLKRVITLAEGVGHQV